MSLVLTGSGDVPVPETLRPHVLNLGFVSEQEKHQAMAGASVFIHPSTNESFGIVLLEAWLAGTPALVHDKGESCAGNARMPKPVCGSATIRNSRRCWTACWKTKL